MKHCAARNVAGKPCSSYPLRDSKYCFAHDPAHRDEHHRACIAGGQHRRHPLTPPPFPDTDARTPEGLSFLLDQLLRETWALNNSIDRARALAMIARVQKDLMATRLLESRIAALENALKARDEPEDDPPEGSSYDQPSG